MVNIVEQTGLEREQTFLAPLALTAEELKRKFPLAKPGAGFNYAVTFLDPTRETLEEMLDILKRVGLPFGNSEHAEILDRFRSGDVPIDNLGVVNTSQNLPDGRPLYWYFVKSPKDEAGTEFTIRSAYPAGNERGRLKFETDYLYRKSEVLYGLVRNFSRLIIPGDEESKGCTLDLRDDLCGSIAPHLGVNVRLKTIEVEVDPTLKEAPLEALTQSIHDQVKTLGAFQTSIRMPHLSRDRKIAVILIELLKQRGAREEDYLQIYPDLNISE